MARFKFLSLGDFCPPFMNKGVPLLGTLQRALKRPRPTNLVEDDFVSFKVTVIKKGEPDYERLLALGRQLILNVETALDEIHCELQRMSGRLVTSDYTLDQIKNYVEIYSLDPEIVKLRIKKQKEEEEEEEEEDNSSDYD